MPAVGALLGQSSTDLLSEMTAGLAIFQLAAAASASASSSASASASSPSSSPASSPAGNGAGAGARDGAPGDGAPATEAVATYQATVANVQAATTWSKCSLGCDPARLLLLLRARLVATCSAALPGWPPDTGTPATASAARASHLQSR